MYQKFMAFPRRYVTTLNVFDCFVTFFWVYTETVFFIDFDDRILIVELSENQNSIIKSNSDRYCS